MKKALWAASLLLVAGTASACGGGDAPSDASKEDFCGTAKEITGLETGKDVKDFAEKLEDVGTPEDMSDDERKGFDLFIETANKLKDDSTEEDATKLGEDLSADEEKNIEAFTTYLAKTCAKELQEVAARRRPRTAHGRAAHAAHGRAAHGRAAHGRTAHGRTAHAGACACGDAPSEVSEEDFCDNAEGRRQLRRTGKGRRGLRGRSLEDLVEKARGHAGRRTARASTSSRLRQAFKKKHGGRHVAGRGPGTIERRFIDVLRKDLQNRSCPTRPTFPRPTCPTLPEPS